MYHYVPLQNTHDAPQAELGGLIESLGSLSMALRDAAEPGGGIKRVDLVAAARPVLQRAGFTLGAAGSVVMPVDGVTGPVEFDAFHPRTAAALTFHGGRAWQNHEAIISALRMAAARDVRCGVVVAPERYKGAPAAGPAAGFLKELAGWRGVSLDLDGIVVLPY